MKNVRGWVWILMWVCLSAEAHPIHISVADFQYSEKDKALQLTLRIFIDDLEAAIRKEKKLPELDLLEPPAGESTESLARAYILSRLQVEVDGKAIHAQFLGSEQEDIALICYIEFPGIRKMKQLTVHYRALMELYDDQSNLVHITYRGPIKSARLTPGKTSHIFAF